LGEEKERGFVWCLRGKERSFRGWVLEGGTTSSGGW